MLLPNGAIFSASSGRLDSSLLESLSPAKPALVSLTTACPQMKSSTLGFRDTEDRDDYHKSCDIAQRFDGSRKDCMGEKVDEVHWSNWQGKAVQHLVCQWSRCLRF